MSFYRPIFEALNGANSRYVVVGGFAVVLRGYARASDIDVGDLLVKVAATADLIALKRRAGRPQDLIDIEALEALETLEASKEMP